MLERATVCDIRFCEECGKTIPKSKRIDAKTCSIQCGNNLRGKRFYYNNPELFKAKRKSDNLRVHSRIHSRVKSRAKKLGIPFNLDKSDIVVPDVCPVLGISIFSVAGGGSNPHNSPSLDRVNPELGYIKGNVRVISNRANLLKSNATLSELELVLKDARRIRNEQTK